MRMPKRQKKKMRPMAGGIQIMKRIVCVRVYVHTKSHIASYGLSTMCVEFYQAAPCYSLFQLSSRLRIIQLFKGLAQTWKDTKEKWSRPTNSRLMCRQKRKRKSKQHYLFSSLFPSLIGRCIPFSFPVLDITYFCGKKK